MTVPATVNGITGRFALDTGIGLTVVSSRLAETTGCEPAGAGFTGRRMSGQEVEVPLATARTARFGSIEHGELAVGVIDVGEIPVDGFLALGFFVASPFTFDYPNEEIVVETPSSLAERRAAGDAIELRLERDGPSLVAFMELTVPGERTVSVEVDTGSDTLILDERFAPGVGIDLENPAWRRMEGNDETGHAYVRTFAKLAGEIHPTYAPELVQTEPEVMFQRIIHDGLIGDAFLRRFAVTYDLDDCSMILSPN